ncbi:MAG: hypothetical protein ACXVPM_17790, partial [Bacteroidia bacterium]
LLDERVQYLHVSKLKNKTYMFFRDVFRDEDKEGISALEFNPDKLDFNGKSKVLFKSSDKVRIGGYGFYGSYGAKAGSSTGYGYDFVVSDDNTKFLYTYALAPKEKKDELNKDVIGMYVFDEDLNKVWGTEFQMPYTEAKMDNLGYTLANDGKVYLLAKVYEGDNSKEGRSKDAKTPNYHFEVLIYDKGTKTPKSVEIKTDNNFPKSAYIYEDAAHNIVIAGFYGKAANKPVDGAYLVKLDVTTGAISKINGGYYEIPTDIIKSFTSEREKRKMEKEEAKDADNDIGIDHLEIKDIYPMPDGSTKIVSEQYYVRVSYYYDGNCHCMQTRYDTFADDIFVLSIDKAGKLEWVKKIPKSQHAGNAAAEGLSINSMAIGNDIHIFYIDNIKNIDLPPTEAPKRHEDRKGGYLTGVTINQKGDVKKYNLGEIETYDTNFYIREFVDGGRNNLISTERRKRKNILFSIDIK